MPVTLDLGLAEIAFVALVACLLGWAALAVLERYTARGLVLWTENHLGQNLMGVRAELAG